MRAFVVCGRMERDAMGERLSRAVRDSAIAEGYRIHDLSALTWVGDAGTLPMPHRRHEGWTVLGDVFSPPAQTLANSPPAASVAQALIARVWGRYVALKLASDGALTHVLRDPSGALDCIVWSAHGLTFVASDTPDWLIRGIRPPWRIALDRVAGALKDPVLAGADLLIDGPVGLLPGDLISLNDHSISTAWRPGDIAACPIRVDDQTAARMLRETVQAVVASFASVSGASAAEISGGFDSSVVAACLAWAGSADLRLWLNAYGPDPAADERPFVEALARQISISPTYAPRVDAPLTESWLRRMPHGIRPSLAALDGPHDADWADRLRAAGVQSLFTGKGGDGLLIQPMTPPVFTDLWRDRGGRALLDPALPAIARRTERSVWTLLQSALANRSVTAPRDDTPTNLFEGSAGQSVHPWLAGLGGLGPAKVYQILGLAHGQTVYGRSLKTERVDLVHPLLAQPVVDLCLALPTYQLTLGHRDRALARAAFADHLPTAITERRSKGELSGYFGRMIAEGLDAVRPWLLDGRLATHGLIRRDAFDQLLRRDSLAWRGGYVEILTAVAFEGWLRAWEHRLQVAGGD